MTCFLDTNIMPNCAKIEQLGERLILTASPGANIMINESATIREEEVLQKDDLIMISRNFFVKIWIPNLPDDHLNLPCEFSRAQHRWDVQEHCRLVFIM